MIDTNSSSLISPSRSASNSSIMALSSSSLMSSPRSLQTQRKKKKKENKKERKKKKRKKKRWGGGHWGLLNEGKETDEERRSREIEKGGAAEQNLSGLSLFVLLLFSFLLFLFFQLSRHLATRRRFLRLIFNVLSSSMSLKALRISSIGLRSKIRSVTVDWSKRGRARTKNEHRKKEMEQSRAKVFQGQLEKVNKKITRKR